MDPLQNRTFCPVITRFHLYFTPNLTGCCGETMQHPCLPIYRVGGYGYVAYLKTDMELLALSVLYLQGSNAGQKYFKI